MVSTALSSIKLSPNYISISVPLLRLSSALFCKAVNYCKWFIFGMLMICSEKNDGKIEEDIKSIRCWTITILILNFSLTQIRPRLQCLLKITFHDEFIIHLNKAFPSWLSMLVRIFIFMQISRAVMFWLKFISKEKCSNV